MIVTRSPSLGGKNSLKFYAENAWNVANTPCGSHYWFYLFLLVHVYSLVSRAKNHAERIFALMPEKNAHSYCTMIRGMVKVTFVLDSFMFLSLISIE